MAAEWPPQPSAVPVADKDDSKAQIETPESKQEEIAASEGAAAENLGVADFRAIEASPGMEEIEKKINRAKEYYKGDKLKAALADLQEEARPVRERYEALARQAINIANKYAERVPAPDRVVDDEKMRRNLNIVRDHSEHIFQTYDEIANWLSPIDRFWQGSPQEVADRLEATVKSLEEKSDGFEIEDSQMWSEVSYLPESVKRVFIAILANEGEYSIGSELHTIADMIRENPSGRARGVLSDRKSKVKEDEGKSDEYWAQCWMRTQAIRKMLRKIYPPEINRPT